MKSSNFLSVFAAAVCVVFSGCALLRQADSGSVEQTLTAAGFQARPVTTAKQQQMLATLPPYKVVPMNHAGRIGYVYAATKSSMLYVGSAAEYRKFQQLSIQENIAAENEMAAMDNEMAAEDWDWDAWGPYWW